jgi:mannose-6-phosphate isomerase-like protein (cupin superfamily)
LETSWSDSLEGSHMPVIANTNREHSHIPGIDHQTLASHRDGLVGLGTWNQTLEPYAETPLHFHECEEVVVVIKGPGRAVVAGEAQGFGPNSTLVIPAKVVHQLVNTGDEPTLLIASLSASPARVLAPDGSEILV